MSIKESFDGKQLRELSVYKSDEERNSINDFVAKGCCVGKITLQFL